VLKKGAGTALQRPDARIWVRATQAAMHCHGGDREAHMANPEGKEAASRRGTWFFHPACTQIAWVGRSQLSRPLRHCHQASRCMHWQGSQARVVGYLVGPATSCHKASTAYA